MFDLIAVFNDTSKHCCSDPVLMRSIENTKKGQFITESSSDLPEPPSEHRFKNKADIIISPKRTFQAAQAHKGKKTCVLNFANSTHPGGGVRNGARAQEECLCRCSTLYFALTDDMPIEKFYHKHRNMINRRQMDSTYNDDCIYSPDITVFKTDTPSPQFIENEAERYNVDVITCAAPNLHPFYGSANIGRDRLSEIHKIRARHILDTARSQNTDVMILGAFGCGAFKNPPEVVAEAYNEVIRDYLYDFETIEFAIVCPDGKPSWNYEVFSKTIK